MKNACDGLIWRLNMVKERISELEDRSIWITQSKTKRGEKNKEGEKKNIQELWYNIKWYNLGVIGISMGKKNSAEEKFEK